MALFVDLRLAAATFIIGWFLLVPIIALGYALYDTLSNNHDSPDNERTALAELKRRYAAGEIDDEEFLERADRLLELEGIEREDVRSATADLDDDPFADRSLERSTTGNDHQ